MANQPADGRRAFVNGRGYGVFIERPAGRHPRTKAHGTGAGCLKAFLDALTGNINESAGKPRNKKRPFNHGARPLGNVILYGQIALLPAADEHIRRPLIDLGATGDFVAFTGRRRAVDENVGRTLRHDGGNRAVFRAKGCADLGMRGGEAVDEDVR